MKNVKLKPGASPLMTRHIVPTPVGKSFARPIYRVVHHTGIESHLPQSEIVLTLAYDGPRPSKWSLFPSKDSFAPFITLPLSILASEVEPLTEADVFFEGEKIFYA
jgi:hypothetical protein